MTDAIAAARDLLTKIPLKIRQTVYGVFGLVIAVDAVWGVIPVEYASRVTASFGVLGLLLALANTSTPLPPPMVEPEFDDEFA